MTLTDWSVAAGARISHAFVCDDVTIGAGALLLPGCVISYGCVIGAGHTVPSYARVTLCQVDGAPTEDSDVETEAHLPASAASARTSVPGPTTRRDYSDEDSDEDEGLRVAAGPTAAVAAVRGHTWYTCCLLCACACIVASPGTANRGALCWNGTRQIDPC